MLDEVTAGIRRSGAGRSGADPYVSVRQQWLLYPFAYSS